MENIQLVGLFFEGVLSFLSPCILPLVPLYIGYITTSIDVENDSRIKVMMTTNCFVLGICTVFFILGLGVQSVRTLILNYQGHIALVGGIVLVVFGLMNLGKLPIQLKKTFKYNPKRLNNIYLNAYVLGFFFSFAWSPCIGPYLSNVLIASATASSWMSFAAIIAYGLGFVIPFLFIGVFSDFALTWIKKHMNIIEWTAKLGGIVIICMGLWMAYDGYNQIGQPSMPTAEDGDKIPAYDFSLYDQYGVLHEASDYLGEDLILQFYASWCTYCKQSMPELQQFAEDNNMQVLLVSAPGSTGEISEAEMITFLSESGITIPTLMDVTTEMFYYYGISGFPTTYFIDKDGYILGYQSGALDYETLEMIMQHIDENMR
ncbi:MAG: cytochrome c biogenesis protein/redoxin [Erysipelotrichaceae bacterium]